MSLNINVPVQKGVDPIIKIQLYDKDTFGSDDLVGTTLVNLRNVVGCPVGTNYDAN